MTNEQLASIRAARLQLLDQGDSKTAATLDWALADPEVMQRGNERETFIKWMSETYPHSWPREDAESAWDNRHVSALAWLARGAHAMATDSADRAHAEAYYRQAEQLLTGNEAALHAENVRLREVAEVLQWLRPRFLAVDWDWNGNGSAIVFKFPSTATVSADLDETLRSAMNLEA